MAGEARFTPSEQDAVDAGREGFRRFLRQPAQWQSLLWLGSALGLVGLALALSRTDSLSWLLWICFYSLLGLAFFLALVVLAHLVTQARTARRLFRQDRGVHVEHVFRWTDEGLAFRSGTGEGRIAWDDLYRWSEGSRAFLFWTTERLSIYLPRRSLDAVLTEDLRNTLTRFGPAHF
jgi:hypothetical protein